jgi:ethanolamine-phosphate cytidylyltransferase
MQETNPCFIHPSHTHTSILRFGNAELFKQAKALGDYLVVGVHSDAEIMKHKGPPVMNEEER